MTNRDKRRGYDVGYGKPPREHQYAPGQSGNPSGRPRKVAPSAFAYSLSQAAFKEVTVKTPNGEKLMRKIDIIATSLLDKAAKGDIKAYNALRDDLRKIDQFSDPEAPEGPPGKWVLADGDWVFIHDHEFPVVDALLKDFSAILKDSPPPGDQPKADGPDDPKGGQDG